MSKFKYYTYFSYFFNFVLALSLVFVGYVIINAESANEAFAGRSNLVVGWLFFLACGFVLKEFLDCWLVSRTKINLIKVILEIIGIVFFTYILIESL